MSVAVAYPFLLLGDLEQAIILFQGTQFEVQAGALTFSVTIYILCAAIAIAIFFIRRFVPIFGDGTTGAELGGNKPLKFISAGILLFLWFMYVLLSALQTYKVISSPF